MKRLMAVPRRIESDEAPAGQGREREELPGQARIEKTPCPYAAAAELVRTCWSRPSRPPSVMTRRLVVRPARLQQENNAAAASAGARRPKSFPHRAIWPPTTTAPPTAGAAARVGLQQAMRIGYSARAALVWWLMVVR
jgi:hypothetical protein